MSESDPNQTSKKPSGVDRIMNYLEHAVSKVDEEAAAERVASLRDKRSDISAHDLADLLIQQKCWQTGAIGAVTSGASIIPGLGTVASLTFGVAADIGMTFQLQAELVLEIANAYHKKLDPNERRNIILLVTGMSVGANKALNKIGQEIAKEAAERLAKKSLGGALPFIGIAASAGTNMITTYIIGQRAQAYFNLGPEAMGDWGESIRAVTGVDERKLATWLSETTEQSWILVSTQAQNLAGFVGTQVESASTAVIEAGKSVGELVVTSISTTGKTLSDTSKGIMKRFGAASDAVADMGKQVGQSVTSGFDKAGTAVSDVGKRVVQGVNTAGQRLTAPLDMFKKKESDDSTETDESPQTEMSPDTETNTDNDTNPGYVRD